MADKGPFCRKHGYFGPCPQCEGTDIVWEIPVVDMHGVEVDTLRISPGREEEVLGSVYVAPPRRARARRQEIPLLAADYAAPIATPRKPTTSPDHVPIGTNPGLLARVKNLMRSAPGPG